MSYSTDQNYVPETLADIMARFMQGVNQRFGTSYTAETFVGTGFYKYFYEVAQNILAAENTFAEAYAKLQDYFRHTNETIAIPKTPREGLIKTFKDAGYVISIEPQTQQNAGTLGVCVLVDTAAETYAAQKAQILTMLKDYTVAGLYYAGTERGEVTLSNGQVFEFGFYPPAKKEASLKLDITLSKNSTILADKEDEVKDKLLANLAQLYTLGNNFEPEKYFTISRDAPYASAVKLQWKTDGAYSGDIYQANFKDLWLFSKERIEVVIA